MNHSHLTRNRFASIQPLKEDTMKHRFVTMFALALTIALLTAFPMISLADEGLTEPVADLERICQEPYNPGMVEGYGRISCQETLVHTSPGLGDAIYLDVTNPGMVEGHGVIRNPGKVADSLPGSFVETHYSQGIVEGYGAVNESERTIVLTDHVERIMSGQ